MSLTAVVVAGGLVVLAWLLVGGVLLLLHPPTAGDVWLFVQQFWLEITFVGGLLLLPLVYIGPFRTHPDTETRIQYLEAMAAEMETRG